MIKLIKLITFSLLLVSCMPIKTPSNSTQITNGFEMQKGIVDFYINDSVTQYFIKPIKFKHNNTKLYSDFTFRIGDSSQHININFSIFNDQKYSLDNIKSLLYIANVEDLKIMYVEKRKANTETRFTGRIKKNDFFKINENQSWILITEKNEDSIVFKPTKKTKKFQKKFQNAHYLNQE